MVRLPVGQELIVTNHGALILAERKETKRHA
jgi:hypothetical protein